MKASHISIFKNGYGYVSLQGQLSDHSRTRLKSLPVPSIGSFWVRGSEGVEIHRVVSGLLDYKIPMESAGMLNLAAANPGVWVNVSYQDNDNRSQSIKGSIVPLPKRSDPQHGNTIDQQYSPSDSPVSPQFLLIKADTGTIAIQRSQITSINFQNDTSEIKFPTRTEKRPGVELQLAAPAPGGMIEASCLSSGISWLPSYRIELLDESKAILHAKATISNNLMDIDNINIELITGFPSLENPESIDPMAMRNAAQKVQSRRYSNSSPQSLALGDFASGLSSQAAPEAGIDSGNLFFYPLRNFSAKSGQVVTQGLFRTEINYKPIYTWQVGDPQYFSPSRPGDTPQLSDVWSCIRFSNPLEMPLTSAPVEFIAKNRIAGSNTLPYTPSKQECTLRINRAINISTTTTSTITKQERITLPPNNNSASKDSCHVSLGLKNNMKEAIEIEISQQVQGKVGNISDGGTCHSSARPGNRYQNLSNQISWTIKLEPKQIKTLTFDYVIVR